MIRGSSTLVTCLSLLALLQQTCLGQNGSSEYSLEQIQEEYVKVSSSLNSIQYSFRSVRTELEASESHPNKLPEGMELDWLTEAKISIAGDRGTWLIKKCSRSGNTQSRSWVGCNGTRISKWDFRDKADPAWRYPPAGEIIAAGSPMRTLLNESGMDHLQMLVDPRYVPSEPLEPSWQRFGTRVIGTEKINGHECVLVYMAAFPDVDYELSQVAQMMIWFDPAKSFLPRRIRIRHDLQADGFTEYEVTEFQLLKTTDGLELWLPQRAVWKGGYKLEMEFKDLMVGQEIPESSFEPEFPVGTRVVEETDGTLKTYYFGGEEGKAEFLRLSHSFEEARKKYEQAQRDRPIEIVDLDIGGETRGWQWRIAVLVAGFCVLGVVATKKWHA